ncbi:MAG TPA: hypothetical protein VFJ21_11880 [Mycobacteriales bacterium]|jgi:hypothetical protein|nr:hypothetical protein [Mycobacteriales bacterium]
MPVTLTHSNRGDVAVIAAHSDPAVSFLCRSLMAGAAFSDYAAVLIDLRDADLSDSSTLAAIEQAARSCLSRRQLLGVVRPGEDVAHAVARVRRGRRLLEGPAGTATTSARVAGNVLSGLLKTAGAVVRQVATARAQPPH